MGTWLRDNCLFLNTSKTESIVFGSHARLARVCEFNITINGCPIKRVTSTEFRYLGILFGECITWKSHVESILSKAGKRVGMLGRIRNDLTHIVQTLYMYPLFGLSLNIATLCGTVVNHKMLRIWKSCNDVPPELLRKYPIVTEQWK